MSTIACLVLFLTCLPCVITSEISFTVTPSAIQHFVTDKLLMRCALPIDPAIVRSGTSSGQPASLDQHQDDVTSRSGSVSDIKHVSSVVITRNNKDIAMVSVYEPARKFENTTGLQVSGQVSANGQELGYLEISYNNPGPDQKGSYTCDINGFDEHGHAVTLSKTIEVMESDVTTRDLVKYIHAIQTTNQQQAAIISYMNSTIHDLQIKDNFNTATIVTMNKILEKNTATIGSMNNTIKNLQTKDNVNSAILLDNTATIANLSTTINGLQTKDIVNAAIIANLSATIKNLQTQDNVNITNIVENCASIANLSTFMQDLQTNENLLTATITANSATIGDLNKTVCDLQTKDDLKTQSIANINSDIGSIINNVSKNLASITTMRSAINDHSVNINKLTTKLNTTVIFSAGIDYNSNSYNFTFGQILIFDKVIFSVGGGYNSTTGNFTCPVAGIYLFHLHVTGQMDKPVYVYIRHNSDAIGAVADPQLGYQSGSNSVTLRLAVGDTVYVWCSATSYPYYDSLWPTTTFTGQLIAMD